MLGRKDKGQPHEDCPTRELVWSRGFEPLLVGLADRCCVPGGPSLTVRLRYVPFSFDHVGPGESRPIFYPQSPVGEFLHFDDPPSRHLFLDDTVTACLVIAILIARM